MAFPGTIYLPRTERDAFANRAKGSFPVEREDFMLGRVEKRHLTVYHIVPTLPEHVVSADECGVELTQVAAQRAQDLAGRLDMQVVGSIHSHPYKRIRPCGLQLSGADYKEFANSENVVLGVLEIVPDKSAVTSFKAWWSFWTKDKSLPMRIKLT